MTKTKYEPPKTFLEMIEVRHFRSADEVNRYEKYLRNPKNSKDGMNSSEREIKKFLSRLGTIEKIPETPAKKTPDFLINNGLFVEVKSINTEFKNVPNDRRKHIRAKNNLDWLKKLNLTLKEVRDKVLPAEPPIMAAIWIDSEQHYGLNSEYFENLMKDIRLDLKGISAILLYFSDKLQPFVPEDSFNKIPILISKDKKILDLFRKSYISSQLNIIS
jgi:hypothetical protein